MTFTDEQLRWFRLRRSGLVEPFDSPEAAAHRLVGVQAQILPAAGLSLWNRTVGLTHATFEHLLNDARSLVKLWGQRHTLHLYPSPDWPLLIGALHQATTWWERELTRTGGDVEGYRRLITDLERLLRERGTLGRSDLRSSDLPLEEWHFSGWGGIFAELVRLGYACHTPAKGGEGRFAHRDHWLPDLPWNPPNPDEANSALARRYFRAYGPATAHDLAYWRGAKVSDARRWVAALGDELAEVDAAGQPMLALRGDVATLHEAPPPREAWPIRLLYRFDPLLLGLFDKSWIVAPEYRKHVWRPAAHIEATLLEHGRIRGTWRYDRKGKGLLITMSPFAPLPEHVRHAVEQHAQAIAAFFGLSLTDLIMNSE